MLPTEVSYCLTLFVVAVAGICYDPSPAFPVPAWENGAKNLKTAFNAIEQELANTIGHEKYDTASFSIELTSNTETLWSHHHTARKHNETRPGVEHVDGDSLYRIASITKAFTTLGVLYQHETGNLSLDKPILDYIPDLGGQIPWKDITVRILASQLSGIPREFAQGDLLNQGFDPIKFGLPPVSSDGLPSCDEYGQYESPCTASDLIDRLKQLAPLFAPNQESTYSNVNFELLGLAIERVTRLSFKEYIQEAIFDPLEMTSSSMDKPSDKYAVLPIGQNYWDVDEGVQNPTGGIYTSSTDMGKFIRYILTHYNAIATGVNWMMPASWATGLNSFYGMPFEIFRTDRILKESKRPVTFVTKGGGVPGYVSSMQMWPEYGLGLQVLVAGDLDGLLQSVIETVTVGVIRAAEELIWKDMEQKYTGHYTAMDRNLNSSLGLLSSPATGLIVTEFISNGTDVLHTLVQEMFVDNTKSWRVQLVPTLLFKNESAQQGEIWRLTAAYERPPEADRMIWDDFCTTDIDASMYAGLPANELVFWHNEGMIELPAWRVKMTSVENEARSLPLFVQD